MLLLLSGMTMEPALHFSTSLFPVIGRVGFWGPTGQIKLAVHVFIVLCTFVCLWLVASLFAHRNDLSRKRRTAYDGRTIQSSDMFPCLNEKLCVGGCHDSKEPPRTRCSVFTPPLNPVQTRCALLVKHPLVYSYCTWLGWYKFPPHRPLANNGRGEKMNQQTHRTECMLCLQLRVCLRLPLMEVGPPYRGPKNGMGGLGERIQTPADIYHVHDEQQQYDKHRTALFPPKNHSHVYMDRILHNLFLEENLEKGEKKSEKIHFLLVSASKSVVARIDPSSTYCTGGAVSPAGWRRPAFQHPPPPPPRPQHPNLAGSLSAWSTFSDCAHSRI